jgi:hypothetical protein
VVTPPAGGSVWRATPDGHGFELHVQSGGGGDDKDCNPTRAHVFHLGSNGQVVVGLSGEDEFEFEFDDLDEQFEELGDEFSEQFEELGQEFEEQFDQFGEDLEEIEEVEDAAAPSDPTVVRQLSTQPGTNAALYSLLGRVAGRGAVATPVSSVGTPDLHEAVSQMRGEVEQLRAMLRELRQEVEARRDESLR